VKGLAPRRQYGDLLRQRAAAGDWGWLARRGAQALGAVAGQYIGRPLAGPILGTLVVTYYCNYRCVFCDLPNRAIRRRGEGWKEFGREELLGVVRGFAAAGTAGIGITGGEPFLLAYLPDLLREIRTRGMVAHVNTNGHFLDDRRIAAVLEAGPDSVNVSLDAADPAIHDRLRGVPGSHARILAGVARLLKARGGGRRPRVAVTSVFHEDNLEGAERLAELCTEIGVDGLGFIPAHVYREGAAVGTVAPARDAAERAERAAAGLVALRERRPVIENSPAYLSMFGRAFQGLPNGLLCRAPWTSLVVDVYGRVFPCVPVSELDEPVATIASGDEIPALWRKGLGAAREKYGACQACYWNCHTELNLLLRNPLGGAKEADGVRRSPKGGGG
jgi:MoaA/NifB/PqqE/SkfB family radical SAM enzyme